MKLYNTLNYVTIPEWILTEKELKLSTYKVLCCVYIGINLTESGVFNYSREKFLKMCGIKYRYGVACDLAIDSMKKILGYVAKNSDCDFVDVEDVNELDKNVVCGCYMIDLDKMYEDKNKKNIILYLDQLKRIKDYCEKKKDLSYMTSVNFVMLVSYCFVKMKKQDQQLGLKEYFCCYQHYLVDMFDVTYKTIHLLEEMVIKTNIFYVQKQDRHKDSKGKWRHSPVLYVHYEEKEMITDAMVMLKNHMQTGVGMMIYGDY